jgi:hypothetical protein
MICKLKKEIKRRNLPMTAEYSSTTNIGYSELILSIYVLALNIIYICETQYFSRLIIKLNKEIINLYYYIHISLWILENV